MAGGGYNTRNNHNIIIVHTRKSDSTGYYSTNENRFFFHELEKSRETMIRPSCGSLGFSSRLASACASKPMSLFVRGILKSLLAGPEFLNMELP